MFAPVVECPMNGRREQDYRTVLSMSILFGNIFLRTNETALCSQDERLVGASEFVRVRGRKSRRAYPVRWCIQ